MKQVFAIFCAVILMPGLNAHAWVGGPWSNNSAAPGGDDGVYEAVATATNGMGMYRWGVRNNASPVGSTLSRSSNLEFASGSFDSSNIWFYRGITYFGMCFGTVNSSLGIVSVIGNGTTNGSKQTTTVDPDTGTVITIRIGLGGPTPSSGNVGFSNSGFTAKFTSKAPVKRFKGSGTISFTGLPDTKLTTTSLVFTTVPSGSTVTETTSSTGGEDEDFPERGHSAKFKVIGSQVSVEPGF